ncbi:MAG: CocE/NonD family hydrolase [Mycobacterium sp.]
MLGHAESSCLTYEYTSTDRDVREEDIGKLTFAEAGSDATPQDFSVLPYLTWDLDTGAGKNTQTFNVRVTEVTDFDAFLTGLPLIGLVAGSVIGLLQQTPLVGSLLAPIIGSSVVAEIPVDVATLAPGTTPVAFTYKVTSFDGVEISTNFFPAAEIQAGTTAPLVLNGPGLPLPGATDPYPKPLTPGSPSFVPPLDVLRGSGYSVITWDPRGEHASGGIFELDNPFYEGRDASAIISWAANNPLVELNDPGDPAVGMVGGSYGGAIQWVTAATDPRVDAIVPSISWNALNSSLYPTDVVKSAWLTTLLLGLVATGARINDQIYSAALTGLLVGSITETAQAVLGSSGSTTLLNQLKAPALIVQSSVDALFPLAQAIANAERILANPFGTEVKMAWFCGLHGVCRTPVNPAQAARLYADTIAWLDTYVAETDDRAADIPRFQWYDQNGEYYASDLLPFQPGFNLPDPYSATGDGGVLPIIPVIGGSGPLQGPDTLPAEMRTFPDNGTFPTPAANAVNVAVTPPVGSEIAGAPQLSFDYQGIGNGKAVFAQLIDNTTGLVVGNMVSAIPVTLNGQANSVSIALQDIAYTVGAGDSLTLQIVGYASLYANSSIGAITISNVQLDLPLRDRSAAS